MKREYDFSRGQRGPVLPRDPRKVRITIRLDAGIVAHFKQLVIDAGGGNYQTLINAVLRDHLEAQARVLDEETLRRVLREELRTMR
jgi:uncharacterized protein (DUF4415 family)